VGIWVIVGGDGLIGRHLGQWCRRGIAQVIVTTRREPVEDGRMFVDLTCERVDAGSRVEADVVFICAAMTNMRACEESPELSYQINVLATVDLVAQFASRGAFVVFLSSNAVFDGAAPWPGESATPSPTCEYGRQKAEAERRLWALPSAADRIAIVRLSKVVSPDLGIVANFIRQLKSGQRCDAFDDLKMAPISLDYVAQGLFRIASRKTPGVFHLSGTDELSYAQFARRLADRLGADESLVRRISSAGTNTAFRPNHPGLGMSRSRSVVGLSPEPMEDVVEAVCGTSSS